MAQPTLKLRDQDLQGKIALVTGASRGIGRAIALNLASRGCSILGTCSNAQSLHLIDTLSHHISELYSGSTGVTSPVVLGIEANILETTTTPSKIVDTLDRRFNGHLDIFINNAAAADAQKVGELTDGHIRDSLTGNIEFPVRMVEELVKRKTFRPNSRIIYISSVRARKAWADQ